MLESVQALQEQYLYPSRYTFFRDAHLHPFAPETERYSPVNAWWLMELCLLATEPEPAWQAALAGAGLVGRRDPSGFVLVQRPSAILVAFPGTVWEDLPDLARADTWEMEEFRGLSGGRVLAGAQRALDPKHLSAVLAPYRDRPVWFAGHGTGAVLATLAAQHEVEAGRPVRALYTFGSPRVGDPSFAASFRVPAFRVVNGVDAMATLPPPWRHRHVGTHVLLTDDGRTLVPPRFWQRLGPLARQTAWLVRLLRSGLRHGYPRAIDELLARTLGDHAPRVYAERLRPER